MELPVLGFGDGGGCWGRRCEISPVSLCLCFVRDAVVAVFVVTGLFAGGLKDCELGRFER